MSARNFLSAREKNIAKFIDCLPNISHKKCGYRSVQELPPLSANSGAFVNRNIDLSFKIKPYSDESLDRVSTPFSDFLSDSETGTPDFRSEESDSSAGSALRRNTEVATKTLEEEWEKIERTLYNEDGEKTTRPHMLEECRQWRQLHPQLRVIGKAVPLPKNRLHYRQNEHDEVIAVHYSDYEQFSESEERLSQSSTDVTPQNSPRVSAVDYEPRITREKISYYPKPGEESDFEDTFSSLLQITPIQIRSPYKKRQTHSILRSEVASSRWMRGNRPDSSVNGGRGSAKSFVSLDTGKYSIDGKSNNGRVVTARHREVARLEPIYTPEPPIDVMRNNPHAYGNRKVSLPPLSMEEEKRKIASVGSEKRIGKYKKTQTKFNRPC
ncbi:uncharacterized protein LOC106717846 isoform X1 [Papilio machaon]|uniref:uncharacterized protein LOC106717846 isoform X1 n=1 Tax=Papilio machaon TaxID=76193 RepID=UPI001E665B0F|nr:uncharacterized protein LOC106717846 isoform X1 [Papilio machaon]